MRISTQRQKIGKCKKKQLMIIKKRKTLHRQVRGMGVVITEVFGTILNVFTFLRENFTHTKKHKKHKKHKND